MSFYKKQFAHLKVEVKSEHQLWITLDNQDQMNAITTEMIKSLCEVLTFADFDQKMRVVVISGAGNAFCAGGDIKAMEEKSGMFAGESNELRMRYEHGIQQIPLMMESLSIPVIALVNGAAIGAGCDLSMMCDLRVGGQNALFAETFTRMGLVPGDGGTYFLSRVLGYSKAMQMFLTGEKIKGEKAFEYGLLNFFFEDSILIEETQKLAEKIAAHSPIAQRLTKKAMKVSYENSLSTSLNLLSSYQGISQRTKDHFEAIKSFKEKREPKFLSE